MMVPGFDDERNRAQVNMESLKSEAEKVRELEQKLAERDASLEWLKEEIDILKGSGTKRDDGKFHEMVMELGKRKESEANMFDSLIAQTKQLEETKILLEEARLEIKFIQNKLAKWEGSTRTTANGMIPYQSQGHSNGGIPGPNKKGKLSSSVSFNDNMETRVPSLHTKNLLVEVDVLKMELTMATQAEEKSKKAMDDLALALKEVATENKYMKDKLTCYKVELDRTKEEAGRLRLMLKNSEEKYREVVEEAEKYKNTAQRLQLEAEESNMAWNEKETEFVNCIKRAEEDIEELVEKLSMSEKNSKEENMKLRDILKQALNEANVAKEAAAIARAENSYLQDSLTAKEQAVDLLAGENELLKINEALYLENINELKQFLSVKSPTQDSEEDYKETSEKTEVHPLEELKVEDVGLAPIEVKISGQNKAKVHVDDNDLDLAAGNETFHSPGSRFHPDEKNLHFEGSELLNEQHVVDCDDRNCKKKKALLRRVGDILKRRTFPVRSPSTSQSPSPSLES